MPPSGKEELQSLKKEKEPEVEFSNAQIKELLSMAKEQEQEKPVRKLDKTTSAPVLPTVKIKPPKTSYRINNLLKPIGMLKEQLKASKESEQLVVQEDVPIEDQVPPEVPVSPGAPKRNCARCNHKYLLSDVYNTMIEKGTELYNKMVEIYKDEAWLKQMKVRPRGEDDKIKIRYSKEQNVKVRLSRYEYFCELCYHQVM